VTMNRGRYDMWLQKCTPADPTVAFTFDTDQCPQSAIDPILASLNEHGLPGTFFCDRAYVLSPGHEAAIHPHVRDPAGTGAGEDLDRALSIIPGAVGCRVHCMVMGGGLVHNLTRRGIRYDSSFNAPLTPNLSPLPQPAGLVLMPVYFMEGQWFRFGLMPDLTRDLQTPGLKIFGFHPVSLWHNLGPSSFAALRATPPGKRYRPELIHRGYGIRDFFLELLQAVREQKLRVARLADLAPAPPEAAG